MAITPAAVRGITGSALADGDIQPFIDAAGCIISQVVGCMTSTALACKDQAEAYLAAHLLTTSPVGDASKQVRREELDGKYSVEYLTPFNMGDGVMSSQYGQTANMLTGGCLAQLDKTPVSFHSVGRIC